MNIYIISAYRLISESSATNFHFYLVYADSEEEAKIKVCSYLSIISPYLRVDYQWGVALEVNSIPPIESLDGRNGSKCYYAQRKVDGEFVGVGWVIVADTYSQAKRETDQCELEGEIIISALPKIHDIIL